MHSHAVHLILLCFCAWFAISSASYGQPPSGPRTLENLIEDGQDASGGGGTKPTRTTASPSKSSSAVRQILDKAISEVKKNREAFKKAVETSRKDYDKANEKPLGEAKRELQDLAKQLIEDGKTEEATAVLTQLKMLEADVMRMAGAGGEVEQKPLLERMEGEWVNPNRVEKRLFSRDGKFTQLRANRTVEVGPIPARENGRKIACVLRDGIRFEAWLIDDDRIAFVYNLPDGSFIGDGEVWFRKQ